MNLAALADHICETVRKTDTDSLAACKNYLKRRDQMLWDGYLWRDSLATFTMPVDPTAEFALLTNQILPGGIVLLPRSIDRVLGLRLTDRALPVQSVEDYFRGSVDAFTQQGSPCEFSLLSPVVWQLATPATVYVSNSQGDDVTTQIRYLDTTSGEYQTANIAVNGAPQVVRANAYAVPTITEIVAVSKPVGAYNVSFSANDTSLFAALNTETTIEPYQRIRLLPVPTAALTLRALVKKKYSPIASDYEEPRLRQAENVLLAYAMGDMCRRQRQFAKADACFSEGAALLEKLANVEFHQQANRQRLVPVCEPDPLRDRGPSGLGSSKGYW